MTNRVYENPCTYYLVSDFVKDNDKIIPYEGNR
jgi:hypothetical protein